ncbi:MAG TPA: GNAT family N-acetyltransferase [Pyrinomonadaceae bacterium]|jgi:predicted N-acetyltransferase YhbS
MDVRIRAMKQEDIETCGRICYEAFKTIAEKHNFPPDFPSPEAAAGLLSYLLSGGHIYSVVAEADGRVVGSNFLWEAADIAGIGPITIDPSVQNGSIGRRLMDAVMCRAQEHRFAGVRLVQAAYHNRSLSLYTKLGFYTREPLSVMQGEPLGVLISGHEVRPAVKGDVEACNELYLRIHGHERRAELIEAINQGTAMVVEHSGRITGYATQISFMGHAVAESNEDMKALIGAARSFDGPGFLLPTRNHTLFRWCLEKGLRVVMPMTLMSTGLYNEPGGAFLPSIIY